MPCRRSKEQKENASQALPNSLGNLSTLLATLPDHQRREAGVTDQQFKAIITHLRIMIVFLGLTTGAVIAIAWDVIQ
jgi:hypothetical protein